MTARPLWLTAGSVCDPMGVPEDVRDALGAARCVEVSAGVSPALALWGRPECIVRLAAGEGASSPAAGVVRIAVAAPPPAERPAWQLSSAAAPSPSPDGALHDATVVMTRPWPDILMGASAYAVRGAFVVPWPLSALVPPPDPGALRRAAWAVAEGRYAAIGVTSARAAEAWCTATGSERPRRRSPFLVAIGQATAASLVMGGLAPDLVTEGGGEMLGEALGEHARGGAVLVVGAAAGRTEAEDAARAQGAEVDAVAAYGMADPPWRDRFDGWVEEALATRPARSVYITWFSPRGVERGMRALGSRLLAGSWVCVGEVTARAARALGEPDGGIEVAETASATAVREAVAHMHRTRRRRHG